MTQTQTVPYEVFQRERQKRIEAEQFIAWEDQLFAHQDLIPGIKLTMRELRRHPPENTSDKLSPVPIWRIAKNTGIGGKTTGKNIVALDKHHVIQRKEDFDPTSQQTQVAVKLLDPFFHPRTIQFPERPKSGYHPPKPTCAKCGDDLEIETAVLCPTCKRKHIVGSRPATATDTELTEKYNKLVRMDEQLIEAPADKLSDVGADTAEEITDNPYIYRMPEEVSAGVDVPSTPPPVEDTAHLLLEIAGSDPTHIEMNTDPEQSRKYFTVHRPLTEQDMLDHLGGITTKGVVNRSDEGTTRALCKDADNPEEWQRCKDAARCLVAACDDFKPILIPSPTPGKHKGGGMLWSIFDAEVDTYSAWQTIYNYTGNLLTGIKDGWPGGGINIRLPGGKYVTPDFQAWVSLFDENGEELSRGGQNLAAVLLDRQTPAGVIEEYSRPEPTPQRPKPEPGQGAYLDKDLAKEIISEQNAMRSWPDIVAMAGGFICGKFLAVWRNDRTPNMAINPRTDLAKDFARPEEPAMDKYDVWCRIMAHDRGQDWQEFKRCDLQERCAYRRAQQERKAS